MTCTRVVLALLAVACGWAVADDRAVRNNYMLHCQGCHTPDGSGAAGKVPSLKGFMGNFLRVEGGREFLIQVPGAAQSALSDAELAELTNWMLRTFSPAEVSGNFRPYDAVEVARLRSYILVDVAGTRAALVDRMLKAGIDAPRG